VVPVAVILNDALPPTHIAALTGSVVITTGTQDEETVTVTVKVLPTHVPVLGVTV
jgi:hypothetical protein